MSVIILRRRKLGATSCREISAKSETGIKVVRNDKVIPADADMVIRWGCTSNTGIRNTINTAASIHEVNDKAGFRMKMDEHDLCPPTWIDIDDFQMHGHPYPLIVRKSRHAQGRGLYVAEDFGQLQALTRQLGKGNYYFSPLINKVAEYRVFVVQGRAVAVAQKTPGNPEDIAWNVARGGRFDNVRWDNWPLKAVKVAIAAFNLSTLDFGGVDVMVDGAGNAYVIEINSAPSLTSDYRQSCMAKAFDWIIRHGKKRIPLIEERGGYRKFIHPAITDKAIVVGA